MERRGKFKKPKRDPFERKRKAQEQIERTDSRRRNWKDYLDEDEEEALDLLDEADEEFDEEDDEEDDLR